MTGARRLHSLRYPHRPHQEATGGRARRAEVTKVTRDGHWHFKLMDPANLAPERELELEATSQNKGTSLSLRDRRERPRELSVTWTP